ncbi:MAG: sulfotransferase [bacterium]
METIALGDYNHGMDSEKPVFIVGCERSGTTLLGLMLMQSEQLHVVHETRFLTTLRDRAGDYGDFTRPHERWFFLRDLQREPATAKTSAFDPFKLDLVEAEEALRAAAPVGFPGASAALFRASAAKAGKSRWGDKTPRYVTHIDWLSEVYPDSQFVHIIRDARDTVRSIMKAGWQPSIRRAAERWVRQVTIGRRVGGTLPPERYIEVRFEELVEQPQEQLERITKWLGLDYSSAMLSYFESSDRILPADHMHLLGETKKPVNTARAYAWKKSMSPADVADIEDIAGPTLEACGYVLSGFDVSKLRKITRSFVGTLTPGIKAVRLELKNRGLLSDAADRDPDQR